MPTDAYWAVACAGLVVCVFGCVLWARFLAGELALARWALEDANDQIKSWQDGYNSRTEQLQATRIALREAQKNDHRDAETGEYVKAG